MAEKCSLFKFPNGTDRVDILVTVGAVALVVVAGMIALSVSIIVIAVEMTVTVSSHS